MTTILHVITGLETGGAETMLCKLLATLRNPALRHAVVSLRDRGTLAERIEALGVPVETLGLYGGRDLPRALRGLLAATRRFAPDLVQGWMYHGNLAATIAAVGRRPCLWNVRQSLYDLRDEKPATAAVIRAGARLSRLPAAILYNSHAAAGHHEAIGYSARRRRVIPNGFDAEAFHPDPAAPARLRAELGVAPATALVGLVARWHPVKDHANFLDAAARLRAGGADADFVLVGKDADGANPELRQAVERLGLAGHVHALGERRDVAAITAGLDLATSASQAEGFPNVLGEAMACAVPAVVTDVGDSRRVLGDAGLAVPPRDPAALAAAWRRLLDAGPEVRADLGARGRRRIEEHYSIAAVARQYENLYLELSEHVRNRRNP